MVLLLHGLDYTNRLPGANGLGRSMLSEKGS